MNKQQNKQATTLQPPLANQQPAIATMATPRPVKIVEKMSMEAIKNTAEKTTVFRNNKIPKKKGKNKAKINSKKKKSKNTKKKVEKE